MSTQTTFGIPAIPGATNGNVPIIAGGGTYLVDSGSAPTGGSAGTLGQVQLSNGSGGFVVGTVPVTVNTTTGVMTLGANLAMGGNSITDLASPVNSTDAASKIYVDNSAWLNAQIFGSG